MKLFLFLLVALAWVDPATVKKINSAKSAAEESYRKGDYLTAIRHYQFLVDSMGVNEDEVVLNLANAFYLAKDTANAFNTYQTVSQSSKTDIRSKANQQLGIMANQQGRSEEALNLFKEAIRAEPSNDDARYNYELLKKKLEEQKKKEEEKKQQNKDQQKNDQKKQEQENKEDQNKDQQEKDQENKDKQNKDQQQKEQEQKEKEQKEQQEQEQKEKEKQEQNESQEKDKQNLDREKLEQMKISEDKARMILEAMKNQEKQYLQQQKRKPTQSRDRNKPDW